MKSWLAVCFMGVSLVSILNYIPKTWTLYEDGSGVVVISLPGEMTHSINIPSCDDDPTKITTQLRRVCNLNDFKPDEWQPVSK